MRDSLTILAGLLIVCLTAALVAPYFVDWNAQRALIERKLTEAAGAPVAIAGPIDVKLLPRPIFKLGAVTLGRGGSGAGTLTADELDIEIALTALMRGEIEVVEAHLASPRLDLGAAANGTLEVTLPKGLDAGRVRFQHLSVSNGTLTVTQAGSGPEGAPGPVTLAGLDFQGEAMSLFGPFKASGRFAAPEGSRPFRLSTGAFDGKRIHVKLGLDGEGTRPTLDFDGMLAAGTPAPPFKVPALRTGAAPTPTAPGPSLDGTVAATGSLPLAPPFTIPWHLGGHVTTQGATATFSDLELRAGTEDRALIAQGDGEVALSSRPAVRLRLHGAQLDLDRLAVAPEGTSVDPLKGVDVLRELSGPAGALPTYASLPATLDLDLGFTTATLAGQILSEVAGHLAVGAEPVAQVRVSANGPEGSRLGLDGTLEPGPAPAFRGHVEGAVRDGARFAAWLGPILPDVAPWLGRMAQARAVTLSGTLEASATGGTARDLTLTLDRSTLLGTVSLTRGVGAERPRLFADLTSDALDIAGLPDVSGAVAGARDLDLDLALTARAVKVATGVLAAVDAGRIALRLTKTGPDLRLERLAAEVGGASVTASGALVGRVASGEARIEAPHLEPLADLLRRLLPGPMAAALRQRAGALSPASVTIKAEAAATGEGGLVPTVVALEGTLGASRVAARLEPERDGTGLDPAAVPVSLTLGVDTPEGTALLAQAGAPAASEARLGPAHLAGTARGSFAAGFDATLVASLETASLAYKGRAKPELGSGTLTVEGSDLGPVLRAAGFAPASATDVVAGRAKADIVWHDATLDLRQIDGRWGGVAFTGNLDADLRAASARGGRPALVGSLTLDRLPTAALFGLALGAPQGPAAGTPWSDLPFGPPLATLPATELPVRAATVPLGDGLEAKAASFTLRAGQGALTLANLTGTVEGGTIGGSVTLRRDGPLASIEGRVTWSGLPLAGPGRTGRFGGTLDFAGSGTSAATLAASLGGSGTVSIAGAALAGQDPGALARTAAAVGGTSLADPIGSGLDGEAVARRLDVELAQGPLVLGDLTSAATLAAGMLRIEPFHVETPHWGADTDVVFDVRTLRATTRSTLTSRETAAGGSGRGPQVVVLASGPIASPARDVEAQGFVNTLQERAIARDQERIDILNQDIRERAFFNRRLKVIEADQAAERERVAREEARASAEAARAAFEAEQAKAAEAAKKAADLEKLKADRAARPDPSRSDAARPGAGRPSDVAPTRSQGGSGAADGRVSPPQPPPRPGGSSANRAKGTAGPRSAEPKTPAGTPSIIVEPQPEVPDPASAGRY